MISGGLRTGVSVAAYPVLKTFKAVENGFEYVAGFATAYHQPRVENARLRGQIADMNVRLADRQEVLSENRRLRDMLRFARSHPLLTLDSAAVISRAEGTIVIDRGALHNVQKAMSVLVPEGIVGVISAVDPFNAYVLTLHNPDCRVGAMIQRNRVRGVVQGSRSRFRRVCQMEYIDVNDEVRTGDLVVTVGGGVFPGGYPIGRVTAIEGEGTLLRTAYIEPSAPLFSLDEVFIVRKAQMTARELTGADTREEVLSRAHPMPDDRTLQERYAP